VIQLRRARGVDVGVRSVKIREAFVRLGPAFVKIGQALSTRRDILPKELCVELSRLQDEMPSIDGVRAMRVIEAGLGAPAEALFEGLDASSEPVAAASLGQVYKARVRGTGEVVAVKVQRDDVAEIIKLDAVACRYVAKALQQILGTRTDLALVTDEVVGRIIDELDYRREAVDAQRFAEIFCAPGAGGAKSRIVVPKVFPHLSSEKVLTLEWVDGKKLDTWVQSQDADGVRDIVDQGVQCTVAQFFDHGFFHADPHPGNLLVTAENNLAYLDFGKMGVLSVDDRVGLMTLLVHFVNRDALGLARDFSKLGFIGSSADAPPRALVDALTKTLSSHKGPLIKLDGVDDRLSFQGVIAELRNTLPNGRGDAIAFRLPPRFATIARALGALEGAVLTIDPTFKVVGAAYPHVAKALVLDRSADARRSLRELILDADGRVRWKRLGGLVGVVSKTLKGTEAADAAAPTAILATVALLGRQASADTVSDVVDFVTSPAGYLTRRALIDDADAAIARSMDRDCVTSKAPKDPAAAELPSLARLAGDVAVVVAQAPDLWMPLLIRAAAKSEAHEAALALAGRINRRNAWRGPAAALEFASRCLALVSPDEAPPAQAPPAEAPPMEAPAEAPPAEAPKGPADAALPIDAHTAADDRGR